MFVFYPFPTMKISFITLLCTQVLAASLHGASPVLNGILPRGGQLNTDATLTFTGERLEDTEEVACATPEIKITGFKVEDKGKVTGTIHIEANCSLGEHLFRLRTKSGLTYARTFWVGQFSAQEEVEPNTLLEQAQETKLGTTLQGVIENEDVDYFKLTAKKGERISVELEGIRLGTINMDPYVAILDSKRFELETCDDSALLSQDPYVSVIAPEEGIYYIEIRDSSYVGNGNYRYRAHVGSFPRPSMVYPASGKAGSQVEVTYLGDAAGLIKETITVPNTPGERIKLFAKLNGLSAPSPNWFRVDALDHTLEAGANNNHAEAKAQTNPPALPHTFDGIIEAKGDEDWFKFTAKKDQKVDFLMTARGVRSPLDGVVEFYKPDGGGINGNDDNGNNPDSKFPNWVCPEDGEYYLKVRDHLARGGPDFVYSVTVTAALPEINASVVRQDRNDTQLRTQMIVARGNTIAVPLTVDRANIGGEVAMEIADLPAGVTLEQMPLPGNLNQYVIAFTAAADAPLGVKLSHPLPKTTDPKAPFTGRWRHNIEWVQGEPNNAVYYATTLDYLPICVVEELPYTLAIEKPAVPAVQSGNLNLKVMAKRKEGFTKAINVRMLWNPPGISSPGSVAIPEGASECLYTLNVNGGAELKTWKIAVTGDSDAGAGPIAVSSPLCEVTVAPPYLTMKIEMAACEQGQPTELLCKLEQVKPFAGKAKVTLYGLPAKATAPEVEIESKDTELRIPVTTAPDTPAGKHQNLFCNINVLENGIAIPHIVGQGGIIRVDPPPPAPPSVAAAAPAPAAAPATPVAVTPAAPKPLSRLEQLRQQQASGK